MRHLLSILAILTLFITVTGSADAGTIKTYVATFAVADAPESDSLKRTLQDILSSRLNSDQVQLVEKADQADILVSGSYARFGKTFSLDALIKGKNDVILGKVFEQGDGQEDIIPALGRLARKIDAEVAKKFLPVPVTAPLSSPAVPTAVSIPAGNAYVIQAESLAKAGGMGSWSSAPLEGVFTSMATGKTGPAGERELFIASEQTIQAYLKGSELKLVAEATIPVSGKILAIDTADLDKDGILELYVSIIDRDSPRSRVYQFNGSAFVLIAENLPWFFRGSADDVGSRTIYAQEVAAKGEFYGDIAVLSKSGTHFTPGNKFSLPRSGNIFNFVGLSGISGAARYAVLDEDGYLALFSPDARLLWKSAEKFGGSESFIAAGTRTPARSSRDLDRWTFLEQRITQLPDGTLIVPHNEGTFSFGKNRSFDKYTLYGFEWNGAKLTEKWHTRPSSGYLADYAFDQKTGEIILLEVVKKPGLFGTGKTAISINKLM